MKAKRKPIAEGDKVWVLKMNTLVHGAAPCVTACKVKSIGKEKSGNGLRRSYRTIYNCTEIHSGQKNLLCDRNSIRPFTNQGKAELLRLLVNSLHEWSHQHRQSSNACLDLAGAYLVEISNLEGGSRGKAHRTHARAGRRVKEVAGRKATGHS